jgi:8-oxo-dGTP pyrophosphatase MutT (NUDIX family)
MGYIDFVRGKYPEHDKNHKDQLLDNFLSEMTRKEKENLLSKSFDDIWKDLWVNHESKYFKNEYDSAKSKYNKLDIKSLVDKSETRYDFQEFGFPKGRRNMKETNIACAEREFNEETGYNKGDYSFLKNYPTVHEEFYGTNGIRYRHIYYVVKMKDHVLPPRIDSTNLVQTGEVQNIGWFSYNECLSIIRPYDEAKSRVIRKVHNDLLNMNNNFVCSNFYYNNKRLGHQVSPEYYNSKYSFFKRS